MKVVTTPIVLWAIAEMRNRKTPPRRFRELVKIITPHLVEVTTRDFESKEMKGRIVIVPIMRAGMLMAEVAADIIPASAIHHIGLRRNDRTLKADLYYENKPRNLKTITHCIVTDPMIATGGSACDALDCIKAWGIQCPISFIALFATQGGISRIQKQHSDVMIFVAVVDKGLNKKGYIIPGCGDAGDRQYGTL